MQNYCVDVRHLSSNLEKHKRSAFHGKMKTPFVILSCLLLMEDAYGWCTIFSGCRANEYCFRKECVPRPTVGQPCTPPWALGRSDKCIDSTCTCNRPCSTAEVLGTLGGGMGGHPDMMDLQSCCRCVSSK